MKTIHLFGVILVCAVVSVSLPAKWRRLKIGALLVALCVALLAAVGMLG